MSQFPNPYGYGQYHGQQPTQPPHPYSYQNFSGYTAPAYPVRYNSSAAEFNRDASQQSFDYNATNIPGLGIPGATPGGAQYHPAPWAQHPMFPATASSVPPPQAYTPAPFPVQHAQSTHSNLPSGGPSNAKGADESKPPASVVAQPAVSVDTEEGELSEGQFEDLYEPREPARDRVAAQSIAKSLPVADQSQTASAADTPEGGFYGTDEDDKEKGPGVAEGRERSASYSPFLSPREIQSGVPTPQPVTDKRDDTQTRTSPASQPPPEPTSQPPVANGPTQPDVRKPEAPIDFLSSFKSLQEARKEAQKAILRLWPLGVKYQNYIDEGFDEKFIKGLFRDLHLDIPKTGSPAPERREPKPQQDDMSTSTTSAQPADGQPQRSDSAPKDTPALPNQSGKGEERKDRIARLLAAKAAKAPVAPKPTPATTQAKQSAPEAQAETAVPAPAPSAPKTKTWGEKERLLQQKIAALQKSREKQNQKPAADTANPGSVGIRASGPPQPSLAAGAPSASIPTGPRASLPQGPVNSQPGSSQPRPFIPGLALPSHPQLNASAQRKRPVAADFVEYSSGSGAVKRPFGPGRNQTSLIIDVSDESDDEDMDVEMDMGSPIEETAPVRSNVAPGQRGPSIRDFPPLSDTFSPRQLSSPLPSRTPPNGLANNKRRETELDMKEKEIQEMRRKIALAEAKRKARLVSGGSATPAQTGVTTPEVKDNDSGQLPPTGRVEPRGSPERLNTPSSVETSEAASNPLPKPSKNLHLDSPQQADRRGRIVGFDLPRIESSLEEKLARLKELRDEEARLQAEIDRSFAEKRRLNDELEQLNAAPTAESPQYNGLGSGNDSGMQQAMKGDPGQQPSEQPSVRAADVSADTRRGPAALTQSGSESGEIGDASVSETDSSRAQSHERYARAEPSEPESSADKMSTSAGVAQPDAGNSSTCSTGEITSATAIVGSYTDPHVRGPSNQPSLTGSDLDAQPDAALASAPTAESAKLNETSLALLTAPEPANDSKIDETTAMELDSSSPSPEAAEPVGSVTEDVVANESRQSSPQLPDQISSVAQPREDLQEIETETAGEVHGQPAVKSGSTLMPYESPLRYFRAYRFHPDYQGAVSGGLKSLTYSHRIDPDKELCPFELNGEQCPANCEFQHFGAISPPDDLILLELGNPDDYSGEEKSRFIQGLRELLQKFKADKVRDFDTIARAIIEFRWHILGDKTKILRLDGVSI
ncbi:hypothetical protein VTK26DRAFT_3859 [Humicola hyalothermophila]